MPFKPPTKSEDLLQGVPFDDATDTAPEAKERFDASDETGTKDRTNGRHPCSFRTAQSSGVQKWPSGQTVQRQDLGGRRANNSIPTMDRTILLFNCRTTRAACRRRPCPI